MSRCTAEQFATCLGHEKQVFNPHSSHVFDICARFDRDYHARCQPRLFTCPHSWLLVNLESDSVTGGVREDIAIPKVRKHFSRRLIHRCGFDTGSNLIHSRFLGFPNCSENPPLFASDAPETYRSGHVTVVAIEYSTVIQNNE